MRSFFYNLDKTIEESKVIHNYELRDFCYEVRDFVLEGTFTRYKKVKTLLDYWGEPDVYVARMTGMKEGTVRVTRRNLSNELYELFGYDFFNVIKAGDKDALKEGRYRLSLANKDICAEKYLYRELIGDISRGTELKDDIDITSCGFEVQFLVKHSKSEIMKEMKMLDKEKLLYLLRMLDNEVDTYPNIHNLVKCFERD